MLLCVVFEDVDINSLLLFILGLCYVIAALIAIVSAASVYMAMQTSPQQVSKRIVTSVGSCLCFVCMAISLPQFFGYESYSVGNGSDIAMNGAGGSPNGFLTTDKGGISQSGIITTIPPLSDKAGNWITFPPGSNKESHHRLAFPSLIHHPQPPSHPQSSSHKISQL